MRIEATKLALIEWLTHLEDEDTIAFLKEMKEASEDNDDWWDDLAQSHKGSIERGLKDAKEGRVKPMKN
jgi:hypothetical protein